MNVWRQCPLMPRPSIGQDLFDQAALSITNEVHENLICQFGMDTRSASTTAAVDDGGGAANINAKSLGPPRARARAIPTARHGGGRARTQAHPARSSRPQAGTSAPLTKLTGPRLATAGPLRPPPAPDPSAAKALTPPWRSSDTPL